MGIKEVIEGTILALITIFLFGLFSAGFAIMFYGIYKFLMALNPLMAEALKTVFVGLGMIVAGKYCIDMFIEWVTDRV